MTKQELVELIKKNFIDKKGDIDLNGLDFGDYIVNIDRITAKEVHQSKHMVNYVFQTGHVAIAVLQDQDQKSLNTIKELKEEIEKLKTEREEINTKEELVEFLKENFIDEDGLIDLTGLDFSDENVCLDGMEADAISQGNHEANIIYQDGHEADTISQNRHNAKDIYQGGHKAKKDIHQSDHEANIIFQIRHESNRVIEDNINDESNGNYYRTGIEASKLMDMIELPNKKLTGSQIHSFYNVIKRIRRLGYKESESVEKECKKITEEFNKLLTGEYR